MKRKPNYKILIISWTLAIAFLIIGIVCLSGGTTELYLGQIDYNYEVEYDEEYSYTYEAEYDGTYYLYISGGCLDEVKYNNGTKGFDEVGEYYDENVYTVDLYEGSEYTFIIESYTNNELKVAIVFEENAWDFDF